MNEAMKQALEALEASNEHPLPWWVSEKNAEAITALRQAIAEAEKQEPVAFASHGVVNWIADKQFQHEAALYTHPQPKAEQEPVAWLYIDPTNPHLNVHYDDVDRSQFPHDEWFPVYKQPKREWVGLTDEERKECATGLLVDGMEFARNIEAKLKQKNGYAEEKNT